MNKAKEELVAIAQQLDTERLKTIQRHQRAALLRCQRNIHKYHLVSFYQIRVDAAAEVLAARKKVGA